MGCTELKRLCFILSTLLKVSSWCEEGRLCPWGCDRVTEVWNEEAVALHVADGHCRVKDH